MNRNNYYAGEQNNLMPNPNDIHHYNQPYIDY